MGMLMSIPYPDAVGKVRKILLFEATFHDSASGCTKLTLAQSVLCIFIFSVPLGLSNSPLCLPLKLTGKDSTEALTSALIASLFSTLIWPYSSTLRIGGCIG